MFTYIVNFKNYPQSSGNKTENLLHNLENVQLNGNSLRLAIPTAHLLLSKQYNNIIAQHVDPDEQGPYTGKIIMEDLKSMGISGSLLNHSENRIPMVSIKKTIQRASVQGFELYVCSRDVRETEELCKGGALNIAYEPQELIGGDISVSTAKPEVIRDCAEICDHFGANLLVGAGIKNITDVKTSQKLGASGVLISSGVIRSSDPKNSLNSLMI